MREITRVIIEYYMEDIMKGHRKNIGIIAEYAQKLNYKIFCVCLVLVLISATALWAISHHWKPADNLQTMVVAFISTFQSIVIGFSLWEMVGKRSFAKDMLDLAKISQNMVESGIEYYYDNFKHIVWRDELYGKTSLKIAFTFGETWINGNYETLELLTKNDGMITAYLPNYNNEKVIAALKIRFEYDNATIERRIKRTQERFEKLGASIFLYNQTFNTSYYLYDDTAIMAPYHHNGKQEKTFVPAIKAKFGGGLYGFVKSEFAAIENDSVLVTTDFSPTVPTVRELNM